MLGKRRILKDFLDGISAGILICIGCSVYLACVAAGNKIAGAILFSVALLCICYKGLNLFTGKVGYMAEKHDKSAFSTLLLGLLGNAVATVGVGFILSYALPELYAVAEPIVTAKLSQEWWQTLVRAIFCGILMFLAVSVYKEKKTPAAIFLCIPVFILSGFEHSIANMVYFAMGRVVSLDGFIYLLIVVVGNAIGGMLLPLLNVKSKAASSVDEAPDSGVNGSADESEK